jgi:hypothetical protein
VAVLTDFTFPFRGGTAFYTGTGATELVPFTFPIAINGRPYLIDTKSGDFGRQFDARVRDSVDQSTEPGESAINPQGLWRRSQSSWHYGAYSDTADAENYRFRSSKGVDVWTKGQLSLLPDTTNTYSTANTNLEMVTADTRLYTADGNNLKYSTDLSTWTTVTGTPAYAIVSVASDGSNVYASFANSTVYYSASSGGTASSHATGHAFGKMEYVKGRLMVAGTGADKYKIWNLTNAVGSPVNNPTVLYSHPNTSFTWIGFAAGQNYIYAGGYSGNKTLIYKTAIKADGTSLDIPTVAGELPLGEVITGMRGYLGNVLLGLSDGFRFCTPDSDGNLVIGPKIVTGAAVETFAGVGPYVYFGWKNYDTTSTGIGRMDLSVFVSTNQPAYASDLMATGQGTIVDIHEYDNKPIFSVAGLGIYKQNGSNLVSSGTLDTGIYRWGVPDAKFIPKWDLRTQPLDGTVAISVASDSGSFQTVGTQSISGSLESTFDGFETKVFEAEAQLTLTRSATDATVAPVVTRWLGRAYAAPLRSQIFSVPVILHHTIRDKNGREVYVDVDFELSALRDLVENPRVVTYQENTNSYSVVVEDVRWRPIQDARNHNEWDWNGTCTVIMRSVR